VPTYATAEEPCQPKLLWIVLLLLTAWISWPAGLALFALLLWSGKLEGWRRAALNLWQEAVGPSQSSGTWWSPRAGGNRAFDEYCADTLRRLEEEEKEFREFLTRLRASRHKAVRPVHGGTPQSVKQLEPSALCGTQLKASTLLRQGVRSPMEIVGSKQH